MSIFEPPVDPVSSATAVPMDAGSNLPDIISAAANLGLLAVAGYALVAVLRQIAVNKEQIQVDRELEAINAYAAYHQMMIDNPELSTAFDHTTCAATAYTQYVAYVMSMLLTIERILTLFPNDSQWAAAFEDDLQLHRQFLCSAEFVAHVASLDDRVADFIDTTAKKLGWTYPYRSTTNPTSHP